MKTIWQPTRGIWVPKRGVDWRSEAGFISIPTIAAIAGSRRRAAVAAPVLIANVSGTGTTNTVTTSSINTTGATFLVVNVARYDATGTLSDSKGNTWTALTVSGSGAAPKNQLFFCQGGTVGSGHTFTYTSGSASYPSIQVAGFDLITASPFDVENGATATSTTIATGSITPSQANTLVIAGLTYGVSGTVSIGSGFTITNTTNYGAGVNMGGSLAYKVLSSASAQNPTWTVSASSSMAARIASFKY